MTFSKGALSEEVSPFFNIPKHASTISKKSKQLPLKYVRMTHTSPTSPYRGRQLPAHAAKGLSTQPPPVRHHSAVGIILTHPGLHPSWSTSRGTTTSYLRRTLGRRSRPLSVPAPLL